MIGWQFLYSLQALGAAAKTREGKRVSHGAIEFARRAVVGLFGKIVRLFCILVDVEAKSCEICGDWCLVGGAFVQALENVIEFFEIVVCAIKAAKRVECLAPHRRILRYAQPKLFGFFLEVPFRSEACQIKVALRLFVRRFFSGAPKRLEFRVGRVLV